MEDEDDANPDQDMSGLDQGLSRGQVTEDPGEQTTEEDPGDQITRTGEDPVEQATEGQALECLALECPDLECPDLECLDLNYPA